MGQPVKSLETDQRQMGAVMTESEFEAMCKAHDLTFCYADDARVYNAGRASLARIHEAAKSLPPRTVKRIWDEVVDLKLVEPERKAFYWITR